MERGRQKGAVLITAGFLLAASCQQAALPEVWLGGFQAFPGARLLCGSEILGVDGAREVVITFSVYASGSEPSEVAGFYAHAYTLPWDPQQESIIVRPEDGPNVLSVSPVSSQRPECGVEPSSADRTVIVVSQLSPRTS
jgi:hypothetical protein